jgi:glutaredoxin 3
LQAFTLFVPRIRVYTTEWCGLCVRAKELLDARGIAYREVALDRSGLLAERLAA